MNSKTYLLLTAAITFSIYSAQSQSSYLNTVTTGVPFLRVTTDARLSGMGDAGIAVSEDKNAIFSNASKNVFNKDAIGYAVNFKKPYPGYEELTGSYFLTGSGYCKLDENNVVSAGFRYFDLGTMVLTGTGMMPRVFEPFEYAADINYARKLTEKFSAGLTLKYIYSDVATGQIINGVKIKPASTVAGDISCFYKTDDTFFNKQSFFSFGVNISNIGDKIIYSSSIMKDFIPANLGVGAAYQIDLNSAHKLLFVCDLNKLLTPTPDTTDWRSQSVVSSIFTSFSDAPNGFEEEIQEITISSGLEYNFDDQLFARGGYFYEHATKGNRKYFTTGIGVRYKLLQCDIAYLIPNVNDYYNLDNVLTVSLSASFN